MTDAPRDVRDRLGEALRLRDVPLSASSEPWPYCGARIRNHWLSVADDFIALARSCGLKIEVDDDAK